MKIEIECEGADCLNCRFKKFCPHLSDTKEKKDIKMFASIIKEKGKKNEKY